ncbi:30S ribosomal protein S15 [Campylobacter insulaenigrae]|uniref:tyrosine-type recombinase/integrase n=1 Tax=Campylobacter insulaenigrae TaxID=260714 RepID=UPI000F6FE86E|nr:site-specific integrase [Campylobacter insulaenigrae]MCR6590540.1 tyrosine-type recombinase/integrase [Campylobacter insulaenigrae]MCR6592077.1 tyrosine-type recombinase/integrase [Campylobacter insulaenigrae]VEJ53399.1 30S ribosomal protein S15 [Campylobacter insulaenigrae]
MVIINDKQLKNLTIDKKAFIKDAYTKNLYIEAKNSLNGVIIFFYFRYRLNKKIHSIKIGKYPTTTLAQAREIANDYNDMLSQSINPKEHIQKENTKKSRTVEEVFNEWRESAYKDNPTYSLANRLDYHVISKYKDKSIDELIKSDILFVFDRLHAENKIETIKRVFLGLRKMLLYAINREYIENSNILTLDIKALYGTNKVQSHRTITDETRFKELLLAIDHYEGSIFTKVALQISSYLFLRSANIRNLEWSEIDFDKKQIIIRANKVKAREDFIVPLSQRALDLLLYVKNFSYSDSKYVFPSDISKSKTMSENTLNQAIKRLGFGDEMVYHGFRATASTFLYEYKNIHKQDSEVIELCLDHRERNKVKAVYNRSLRLDDRRELMQWWSDFIDKLKRNE